jgi:hypothetical protein
MKIDPTMASSSVENIELYSFFSRDKYLTKYLNKLAQNGIYKISDIDKVVDGNLFDAHKTSQSNENLIRSELAKIGVHL